MSVTRVKIENFKSIKKCDISIVELNLLIGENGTGKTNILDSIKYYYSNITENNIRGDVFDLNNSFSNEVRISLSFNLSRFINIYLSNDIHSNSYLSKIWRMTKYGEEKVITLEMRQIRNKGIVWNYNYKDRFILKSLFPLFFIDTRNIKLLDWNDIWNTIGDLSKVSDNERKELHKKLHDVLSSQDNKIAFNLQKVESILSGADVSIKRTTSRDFAKSITQFFFEGSLFRKTGYDLSFFSDGTNSANYIKLLIRTVFQISKVKLKQPLIIIDEPEINLHNLYIDEISEELLSDLQQKIHFIIATHSSRLTKNIIKSEANANVYNVRLIKKYTYVNKMRLFTQIDGRAKYRVTDEHANAYFSKGILLVEGETELELLSNPYLKILFPEINKMDVYKALSDEVIRDIIHPNKIKTNIPYFMLLDLDKVIKYKIGKNIFTLADYLKDENNKERYLINQKNNYARQKIYDSRKRIYAMTEKCRFHISYQLYSCTDINFIEYICLIKDYFKNYNTYVFKTTIEGSIITFNSKDHVFAFTKLKKNPGKFRYFEMLYNKLSSVGKLNVLRLLYNGKTDLLQKTDATNLSELEKLSIYKNATEKTDLWITDFFDYYFKKILNLHGLKCLSVRDFSKALENKELYEDIYNEFNNTFEELGELFKLCKLKIRDTI